MANNTAGRALDETAGAFRRGNGRTDRPPYDLDAVLDVAVATFNERGYEATSISVLAERLGTSKSALYYHVSGKEELLDRALSRALDALEGEIADAEALPGSAAERLEAALRGAVRALVAELPAVTLLLRVRGNTEVEREALRRRRSVDHRLSALVDAAHVEGSLRADLDSGTTSRLLFGMINSLVEWYHPDGPLSAQGLADTLVSVAMDGLRA
ncbi:TetR/AcrR family transcriptional regulator [Microbacterium rhizosphaerae]|uniref:TetR/AcrR family transcriptional regulator n=1 Tax=Microbacterium rhizosphaerae TaxID=1678237 RepID=A0ABZ0STW1_9MICO|nr:TetR/AcrR family transcriptional regulator [Microbacterium rhizosphaerae]WPR90697.1 TetR/AcrR family transcriptional regulator [Microbacterium rhizosphaerae]